MTSPETVFTYGAPGLKFGSGSSSEIWFDDLAGIFTSSMDLW